MTDDAGLPPAPPRWLGVLWTFVPAAAPLAVALLAVVTGRGTFDWWTWAGLLCAAAYVGRQRWPAAALGVALAIVLSPLVVRGAPALSSGFNGLNLLLLLVPTLPLVAVATRYPPRWSGLGLLATLAATMAVMPEATASYAGAGSSEARLVGYVLAVGLPVAIGVAAWLVGYAMHTRRRYAETLLERAVWLEQGREAESARAVAEERTRIARELHDVVTHNVAVMVVQAAASDAVWDRDPAQARASVRAVEESGRSAMGELRAMLGAMRGSGDDEAADRGAQPGLGQLPALVDQVRAAGLDARLSVAGDLGAVPAAADLSLLRIAREAVTNALRHADARRIEIAVAVEDGSVALAVTDDGVGLEATRDVADPLDPARRGGHGVLGMRERAAVLHGTLTLEPAPRGGTVVAARVPLVQDGLR